MRYYIQKLAPIACLEHELHVQESHHPILHFLTPSQKCMILHVSYIWDEAVLDDEDDGCKECLDELPELRSVRLLDAPQKVTRRTAELLNRFRKEFYLGEDVEIVLD